MTTPRLTRTAENQAMQLRPTSRTPAALAVSLTLVCVVAYAQDKPSPISVTPVPLKPGAIAPQTKTISELMDKTWKANNVKPSARATDYDFLRRAFLDLIGRIATPV